MWINRIRHTETTLKWKSIDQDAAELKGTFGFFMNKNYPFASFGQRADRADLQR